MILRFPQHVFELLTSDKDSMVPPSTMLIDGSYSREQFIKFGNNYLNIFKELSLINSESKILDIGSGNCQKAVALTKFLSEKGQYEGFDIFKPGIEWGIKKIKTKHPQFNFTFVDVFNKTYHPEGKVRPLDFKFPYSDNTFDFAFLVSVFTHMVPGEVQHYLKEIARVLKPEAKCLATFFLLNDEVIKNVKNKDTERPFPYIYDSYATINPEMPEDAIAYYESDILKFIHYAGFKDNMKIYRGSWSRTATNKIYDHQDFVILTK